MMEINQKKAMTKNMKMEVQKYSKVRKLLSAAKILIMPLLFQPCSKKLLLIKSVYSLQLHLVKKKKKAKLKLLFQHHHCLLQFLKLQPLQITTFQPLQLCQKNKISLTNTADGLEVFNFLMNFQIAEILQKLYFPISLQLCSKKSMSNIKVIQSGQTY